MRHMAGRVLLAAHPWPSLNGADRGTTTSTGSLTTSSRPTQAVTFTPAAGDVLVVKASTGTNKLPATSITNSGAALAWTQIVSVAPTNATPWTFWTAVVPAAQGGVAMTVTVTFVPTTSVTGNSLDVVVERYGNARIPTPANVVTWNATTAATSQSTTLTATHAKSLVSWAAADFDAYGTSQSISLLSGSTQTIASAFVAGIGGWYYGSVYPNAAVAQTLGLTQNSVTGSSSTGVQLTIAGVEIRPIGV